MIMATQMQFHFAQSGCPCKSGRNCWAIRLAGWLALFLNARCSLHAILHSHLFFVPFVHTYFSPSLFGFGIFCFDFTHFGLFLFLHCQLFSGGCINASPAGKRRIANGIQQQQFGSGGDDGLFGISGKLSTANDVDGNNAFGRITPATTAITAIVIAACVLIISVFAIVVVILQVRIQYTKHIAYLLWKIVCSHADQLVVRSRRMLEIVVGQCHWPQNIDSSSLCLVVVVVVATDYT